MKKLIIIAVSLLTISAASFAGNSTLSNEPTLAKSISSKVAFTKIEINGNMDVVLTENNFVQVDITGEQKSVESVSYFVKKGTLYINRNHISKTTKPVVRISVNKLQSIEFNGDGEVISNGTLSSKQLKLVINGAAKFNVRNLGEILVESDEDIDLHYEKKLTKVTPDATTIPAVDAKINEHFMKTVDSVYCKK